MSYLIAASLIYHTWTAWMFNLPGEIFLCAHMPIYHFVTILARFFPLIHTFQARACGKSGLVIVRFFFFKSDFVEGGDTHNDCVEDEGAGLQCASCSVSPLALLPWGKGWQCLLAASRHVHPDTGQSKQHTWVGAAHWDIPHNPSFCSLLVLLPGFDCLQPLCSVSPH